MNLRKGFAHTKSKHILFESCFDVSEHFNKFLGEVLVLSFTFTFSDFAIVHEPSL
jgi:hypothetical protein